MALRILVVLGCISAATPLVLVSEAHATGPTSVSGTINSDTTWTRANSPYVVTSTVTIATGVTLTVDPGVVVKFNAGLSINVNGRILAEGTAARPITFTSSKDDTVAGDTNGDGGATTPTAGDWSRLLFQTSSTTSKIDHATIRYGGPTPSAIACDLGSTIEVNASGRLEMTKTEIKDSKNAHIKVDVLTGTGVAKFNHDVFGAAPCGGYIRDGEVTENLFIGPFTSSDRAFYSYEPDGLIVQYNTFFGQPAWNDSNDTNREAADVRFNVFLKGVRNEATSGQNLANLQDNYWGRVLEATPSGCWSRYPPYPITTYFADNNCPPDNRGVTGYVHNVLPAQDAPSPQTVYAQVLAAQTRGRGDGLHARSPIAKDGDPVNTATGAYTSSVTDAQVAGLGPDLQFSRFYNSDDTHDGLLGPGWSFSYGVRLTVSGNDATVTTEDGQQLTFSRAASDEPWVGAPGVLDTLQDVGSGHELTRRDQTTYAFNSTDQLVSEQDRNGQGPTFTYDAGHLASIDLSGRTVAVDTNTTTGHIERLTLPDDRYVEFTYTDGLLTAVRDLRGNTTAYTYDTGDRLDSITDQRGKLVVRNVYDGTSGRVTEQRDARNNLTTFGWNPSTGVATVTDPNNHTNSYLYVNNALITATDAAGGTTFNAYDQNLNTIGTVSPRGFVTVMRYDSRGNLTVRARPDGTAQQWTYNADNTTATYIDARLQTTTFTYDTNGNPNTIVQPAADGSGPITTDFDFNLTTGTLDTLTDARAKTTTFAYNGYGDLTSETSPEGNISTLEYDDTGRVIATVEPRGNASGATPADYRTTIAYNDADQPTTITSPLGHATTSSYDTAGNLTGITDARNKTTAYAYDDDNHLLTVTAPDTTTTTYAWDGPGNMTSRTDANSHQTTYAYDAADRPTSVTPPSPLGATTFTYDKSGNRATMTQPGSLVTNYLYDSAERLIKVDWPGSTPDASYEYDANDNRTKITDANGSETRTYDAINRVTAITRGSDTLAYLYDKTSNVTRRTYPSSIGSTVVDYTYDDDNRLATLASASQTTTYTYDEAGHLTATTLPTGSGYTESREWDNDGRLIDIRSTNGTNTIAQSTYTLDEVGNPLSIETADPQLDPTSSYTYDDRNRLTRACYATTTCNSSATDTVAWTYDAMSNRTTEATPLGTTNYAYNAADELCWTAASSGSCGSPPSGATTYQYDNRGNMTSAGMARLTYDAANRTASYAARATGTDYSTTILPAQPLGYWRLGESSGTTATDASGNGRNGTYVGNPSKGQTLLVWHDSNNSVSFDAVDDSVTLPVLPIANTSFSIELWSRANAPSAGTSRTLFGAHDPAHPTDSLELLVTDDGKVKLTYGTDTLETPAGTYLWMGSPARSVHLVVSYDTTTDTSRIYVNGQLRASGNQGPFVATNAPAYLGYNGNSATPRRWKDHIDEAAVYSRALKTAEVANHWMSGRSTTTYAYDGDNKRYRSTEDSAQTNYTWDPNNAYPQLIAERAGSNLQRRYTYDDDALSVTNNAGATSWYHQDKLGNTLALTAANGTTQQGFDYEPYGATRNEYDTAAATNPLRFTGQYLDRTGLYHLRARQYAPPIGFTGRDPLSMNDLIPGSSTYNYAFSSPNVWTDVTGLRPASDAVEEFNDRTSALFSFAASIGYGQCQIAGIGGTECALGNGMSYGAAAFSAGNAASECFGNGLTTQCGVDLAKLAVDAAAPSLARLAPGWSSGALAVLSVLSFATATDVRAAYAETIASFQGANKRPLIGMTLK